MKRRAVLAGGISLIAAPALARPVMPLFSEPREILSPKFRDGKGRVTSLQDFRGQVVLLNVWATWCVPCREEMPTLDRLQEYLGGDDFQVVALSIDKAGMPAVKQFFGEIGIQYLQPYIAEGARAQFALGVRGLPTTILIDRNGKERGRLIGPAEWDSPEVVTLINETIADNGA